jgi:hypothetical protein
MVRNWIYTTGQLNEDLCLLPISEHIEDLKMSLRDSKKVARGRKQEACLLK